jgi:hypothetical protein
VGGAEVAAPRAADRVESQQRGLGRRLVVCTSSCHAAICDATSIAGAQQHAQA